MAKTRILPRCIYVFFCSCIILLTKADDIERTARKGTVLKLLREMVNQTKADTLNLPANATSIRENITDTFSCENRTYGYYADVDNECQIFHVCLTSRSTWGRSATYRWSFICPNETLFNQAVLTCTRPRDSIPCEEAPMYYYMNDEIGKVPNDTESTQSDGNANNNNNPNSQMINNNSNNMKRRKPVKKQNMIVESLMQEVKKENLVIESLEDEELAPVIEETVEASEENVKPYKETEFDDKVMNTDAVEILEIPKREKEMVIPIHKEVAKKPNKKHKIAVKPLVAMMMPEKETDSINSKQDNIMKDPNKEITLTPIVLNHEINKAFEDKHSDMIDKEPVKETTINEESKEITKVIPQKETNNHNTVNTKPNADSKSKYNNIDHTLIKSSEKHLANEVYAPQYGEKYIFKDNLKPIKIKSDTDVTNKNTPEVHEVNSEYQMKGKRMENARLAAERSLKRKGKKISRGSIRFSADKVQF